MMRSLQETVVPTPLLETKLYLPRPRRGLVPRPRLSERLDRGAASKLMLVSAPAGFGKTTLLAEWLAAGPARPPTSGPPRGCRSTAATTTPAPFWTYVIAALRTAAPGVGAERARAPAGAPTASDPDGAHHAAQRPRRPAAATSCSCSTTTTSSSSREVQDGDGVPARPPAPAAAPGDRQPRRPARCRSPGCGRGASWSRPAPPTCASRPTRPRRTSTG